MGWLALSKAGRRGGNRVAGHVCLRENGVQTPRASARSLGCTVDPQPPSPIHSI